MTPAQSDVLTAFYQAVRERFAMGITVTQLLVLVGLVAALVLAVVVLKRFESSHEVHPEPDHAGQLFQDVLLKLELPAAQREYLERVSRELQLGQPAVMLLSERCFDDRIAEWKYRTHPGQVDQEQDEFIRRIRDRLFPTGAGWVCSPGA